MFFFPCLKRSPLIKKSLLYPWPQQILSLPQDGVIGNPSFGGYFPEIGLKTPFIVPTMGKRFILKKSASPPFFRKKAERTGS
jgi:hypothetical protein